MIDIQHHKLKNISLFEDRYSFNEEMIHKHFSNLSNNRFGEFMNFSMEIVYLSKSLSKGKELNYIDLSSQLVNGLFTFACDFSDHVEFAFNGESLKVDKIESFNPFYYTDYISYIEGLYLAILAKNQDCLDTLLQVPLSKLDQFSKGIDPFFKYYARFLKAVLLKDDKSGEFLIEAIKSSFPKEIKLTDYDFLEANHIIALECWAKLLSKDENQFISVFEEAINVFKNYWSSNKKLNKGDNFEMNEKSEGYLSIPLSAIAQVASDNGLNINVQSPYIYDIKNVDSFE